MNFFFFIIIVITIIFNNVFCVSTKNVPETTNIMNNFNTGLKLAGQMFGINTAADVANLVAKAFSKALPSRKNPNNDHKDYSSEQEFNQEEKHPFPFSPSAPVRKPSSEIKDTSNLIRNLLKIIGFDAEKLGALAINALIMVAQAIGNTLIYNAINRQVTPPVIPNTFTKNSPHSRHDTSEANQSEELHAREMRKSRIDNLILWFMENSNDRMRALLNDMADNNLPDRLISVIADQERRGGSEGSCLKMLMCKSSPFIWGMQKSLANVLVNDTLSQAEGTDANNRNKEESDQVYKEKSDQEQAFMNTKAFFKDLPSLKEFRENGYECEKRYMTHCNISKQF